MQDRQFIASKPDRFFKTWEQQVQTTADILGLIPGLNIPAEIVSGLLSLRQGDFVGFGLSMAGLVPIEGEWAIALKIARTAKQLKDAAPLVSDSTLRARSTGG